ncbi:MAG: serine/threonine protein kinase [Planctomycetota bacterium]|jgi:serine/threonine protein kinase
MARWTYTHAAYTHRIPKRRALGNTHDSQGREELVALGRVLGQRVCGPHLGGDAKWDPLGAPALSLWDVLSDGTLSDDERELLDSMLSSSTGRRTDRVVERRIERALRSGFEIQASANGIDAPGTVRVVLVRQGMSSSNDVAGMEPGEPIDALIDQIIAKRNAQQSESEGAGAFELKVEIDGEDVSLPKSSDDEFASVHEGMASLTQHMAWVLDLEGRTEQTEDLEERDLAGVLLGGKYRVKRLKGKGGFGNVYEAVDEMLGARVALKVLNRRAENSPRAIENFLQEAKLLTSIDHENIVRWITFDRTEDGLHYFVMEYLGGEELEEILQHEARVEPKRAAEILLGILGALRAAHRLDSGELLHLDLKPENVFVLPGVEDDGVERVKVIDFGISQHVGAEARQVTAPSNGQASSVFDEDPAHSISASVSVEISRLDDESGVTRVRGGTLLYSSPEQIKHLVGHEDIQRLDGRSDLYSLGIMAYRMLTSRFPFEECDTAISVINNHLKVAPTPLAVTGNRIPRKLALFVDRCLAKDREDRWRDSAEAYEFLDDFVHPKSRLVKIVGAVAVSLIATLALIMFLKEPPAIDLALLEPIVGGPAQTVSMGVGSPAHELDWKEWPSEIVAPRLALVGADGVALHGWTLEWIEGSRKGVRIAVDIDSPPPANDDSVQAHVSALSDKDVQRVMSWPFQLKFLGPWAIEANLRVVDYDEERALDPQGRVLELVLRGSKSGLESIADVELLARGKVLTTVSGPVTVVGDAARVRLPLDKLRARAGETELLVVARDHSGRMASATHRVVLAAEPAKLDLGRAGIQRDAGLGERFTPVKGRYSLDPQCSMIVAATGLAEVWIDVIPDGASTPIRSGGPFRLEPSTVRVVALADLGLDPNQREFSGKLVVRLSEESFVDRAGAVDAVTEYAFNFYPRTPELSARLASANAPQAAAALSQTERAYFNWSGAAVLRVERSDQARNLLLETLVERQDGDRWVLDHKQIGRIDEAAVGRATDFAFQLQAVGVYRFRVRAFDEVEGERGPEVGHVRVFEVVLDTEAPKLTPSLTGFVQGGLVTSGSSPKLGLVVDDSSAVSKVSWQLTGPDGTSQGQELATSEDQPGKWTVTDWPSLWSGDLATSDGTYSLELTSTDLAGNRGRAVVRWNLAIIAPEVRLVSPVLIRDADGSKQWPAAGSWNVSAVVRDPNDVQQVKVRITNLRTSASHALELRRMDVTDTYQVLPSDRPRLNPRWSTDPVRVEIIATDAGDNQRLVIEEARLPLIERVFHPRIVSTAEISDVMIFVPGNEKFEYVAGGRQDEGHRYERLEVPVARGKLEPYYLDRDEVSNASYLHFVLDEDGYASQSWWPMGSLPDEARMREQGARLRQAPTAPVTGVNWAEAFAFARYHGKRLPTLAEWEFAVRGGEAYRAHSMGDGRVDLENADEILSGVGVGLRDLSRGVREWTSTPGSFFKESRTPRGHFRAYSTWFLRTPDMVASGDLDGDGLNDHAAVMSKDNRIEVWLSRTSKTLRLGSRELTIGPRLIEFIDVDGDKSLDLVVALEDGRTVEFLNANGQFTGERARHGSSWIMTEHAPFLYRYAAGALPSATEYSFLNRSQQDAANSAADIGFRCALDADRALELEQRQLWIEDRN